MALSINASNSPLNISLNKADKGTKTAFERLSSGLKVNSAKDNAAALFTIQQQTADIRGIDQAIRNAGDGISLAQTAQGALGSVNDNNQRIRELALQAANPTVENRDGIQAEIDQLTQENSRIAETTSFNGQSLFQNGSIDFQLGEDGGNAQQVSVDLQSLDAVSTVDTSDLNATGTVDVSSAAAAQASLSQLDSDINAVSLQSGNFGAAESRFSVSTNQLADRSVNLQEARSRIQDADIAEETARKTRSQILSQSAVLVLQHNPIFLGLQPSPF
ncbi:MAG: flagellin FliC [Methylococcales bacterium]|jgi:flagellin|nr:flagellin FliC [Methylococcales bacterium]MBT7445333.1 flagellin FliC [Methylococcales bacterium]